MHVDPKDKDRGLYGKFHVARADGSSEPGGKHEKCRYFVLDLDHDPFAPYAILVYALQAAKEYPNLAADLYDQFTLSFAQRPEWKRPPWEVGVSELNYQRFVEWYYGYITNNSSEHNNGEKVDPDTNHPEGDQAVQEGGASPDHDPAGSGEEGEGGVAGGA